jgi:flagellar hook-associated protein 1 FlgK
MSLNSSLSSALSGLSVASRRAAVVSSNIANAATPGYGRRVLQTAARTSGTHGYGVVATGVTRMVDMRIVGERRLADSGAAGTSTLASFYKALELKIGTPDEPQSLSGRVATLDQSFLEATSHPESEARLDQVASSAKALASTIKTVSDTIQDQRVAADTDISNQVQQLSDALNRVADLNSQIRDNSGAGSDPSALMDQRQQLIDSISSIVPLREYDRGNGQIALMTSGGQMLVDGGVAKIEFTPVGVISPAMTLQSGALGALMIDGRAVDAVGDTSPVAGGSLAALFKVRDVDGVAAQANVDAVARDLVERFQDPSVDATRAAGDPGLFTDGSAAFDPANEIGLAQRLQLNPAVDPDAGGQLWHLRDGLGATAPGASGNASLLNAWESALTADRSPVSGNFMTGARSFSELSGDFTSQISTSRLGAENDATYAQTQADTMKSMELENGVDTDQEMQDLLQIEQAYSANAKVMSTIDDMIKQLMDL